MTESDCVLPRQKFSGHLIVRGPRVPVALTAGAGRSGSLELDIEPGEAPGHLDTLLVLRREAVKPGQAIDEFSLECEAADGKCLTSDRVYLADRHPVPGGTRIKLRAREAFLTMPAREPCARPQLRYRLLGFKCGPPVTVETRDGQVEVQGALQTPTVDEMTGWIAMEGPAGRDPAAWRKRAEPLLEHVRSVLSFSRGAPLPAPIREFCAGDRVHVTFREADGGYAPLMPPVPHLALEPLVTTAVTNIEAVDAYREAFELAIGWLAAPSMYDEVRFLSGMIALESVSFRTLERSQTHVLGSSAEKRLARRIREIIDEREELDDDAKCSIERKIPELNRRSWVDVTEELLDRWQVARVHIDAAVLERLVKLRNLLVHQGAADDDLWPAILLVREILVRLVLSILQFEGTYHCYIDGRHRRRFPDCERID